ncbi:Bacillosamine/Legionaminic acid biosynthesis aminotransferase PglE; 4-keto-6-deoxy-N-Acetyl-D-hexosaminyl-(Lipid carrier) aminotransferase [Rhodococcus wratislaviensis]|uniref:Bacillosamine/Legionaminic acid biosynthesis aminotransferase PglE 4-keto-6-deoxy-N-Acetyl-D-hexosaminyl-(Lipid carrier) aminotransferase n=1 Tax=Rhodococcus wratislaviensis TaxID=44752 RepID=A0A402BYE2_RHOWR|nr:DegT/DnrJ/EryC1/StrS family aminotransferase [Rhodococcus wratislaviensis]GCE36411.1 Bacillosamine/Legionaminic acid biosynthesis aminotransferase PglE; 4-keto-6-deoxy-N-Acetyl-D-hexosaminyl-(Lipid carrier) aminotransferase [Rhodococcus wratislaviensis]
MDDIRGPVTNLPGIARERLGHTRLHNVDTAPRAVSAMMNPNASSIIDNHRVRGRTERIPVAGPWVTDLEVQYVAEAAANDWYDNAGQSVDRFETEFADYLGIDFAAAVPHCTSALHLAMLALDIGPGDEVIVPESTWVATAAPIDYVGATPVFADIDPTTWCLSPDSLEKCLSPRTKAIVTVDLYGGIPDMEAIAARAAGIPVIEDAAQAIGAFAQDRAAGTLGEIGTFSFHGTKTVTTGEGGMAVTSRSDLFERISRLRDHGRTPAGHRYFVTDELGFKYRMSSLQAAFGRAQLARIDELVGKKRQIFEWYEKRLGGVPGLRLNSRQDGVQNTFWMVTVVVDRSYGLSTRRLMELFDLQMVDTRPFLPPLSSLPAFSEYDTSTTAARHNRTAYDIASRAINLPSALRITEEQVDKVCDLLQIFLLSGKGPT